jgi:hypothetical protein
MMKQIKSIVAFVALKCGIPLTRTMANADPDPTKTDLTHKDMLWKLLGLPADANPDMVNERFKAAMAVEPDEDDKKKAGELKAANEKVAQADKAKAEADAAKVAAETAMANEKSAKEAADARAKQATETLAAANEKAKTLETQFANERTARIKLELDAAIIANKITGAQRKEFEAEFANAAAFDATLKKLAESKGTKLPTTRQAANIGARKPHFTPEGKARQDKIAEMVNEESKKACYRHLPDNARYSQSFTAVMNAHPELKTTETK